MPEIKTRTLHATYNDNVSIHTFARLFALLFRDRCCCAYRFAFLPDTSSAHHTIPVGRRAPTRRFTAGGAQRVMATPPHAGALPVNTRAFRVCRAPAPLRTYPSSARHLHTTTAPHTHAQRPTYHYHLMQAPGSSDKTRLTYLRGGAHGVYASDHSSTVTRPHGKITADGDDAGCSGRTRPSVFLRPVHIFDARFLANAVSHHFSPY